MWLNGHLVALVILMNRVHSQPIFNPINNLPVPGQSGNNERIFARRTTKAPKNPTFPNFGNPPIYPTEPPISGRPSISQIVQEAVDKVKSEDNMMKIRLNSDVDRPAANFDTPDPLLFSESPEDATQFAYHSRTINWIARLLRKYNSHETLNSVLSSSAATQYSIRCPFVPPRSCEESRYRTLDGTCNNLDHRLWGSAFIPFERLLPAKYESSSDRDDGPQVNGQNGVKLPNARVISTRFHEPGVTSQRGDDSPFTMLLTVFGQFVAHDLTDRAPSKGYLQSVLKCCNQRYPSPVGVCDNIELPKRDAFRQAKGDCLEFPRSLEVTDINCRKGTREQLNQASSYIDGGAIYGATKEKSDSLREFKGGLLMTSVPNQLPISPPGNAQATTRGFAFYSAGDNRVNEFIGLIGIETLWVREHNRIAVQLSRFNPSWEDEAIYQETRRIIIALIQHVTYAEYLPGLLGPDMIRKYRLKPLPSGQYNSYNRRVNPGITNSFAAVAMRYGHSMLRTTYNLLDRSHKRNGDTPIDLKDSFFRPQTFLINENPLMRGMATDASKLCDRVFSGSAINNLYMTSPNTGTDLAASNIQRSREHGLPNYTSYRKHFAMSTPTTFGYSRSGFPDHSREEVDMLKKIYSHPEDVDVFSGGVSERPASNGAVGPLFGNILGDQFQKLREGDRYWYETSDRPQAFTAGQLGQIRKVKLARIICNVYSFDTIQTRVFHRPSASNPRIPCDDIPSLDLNYWISK